ncbi:MAG: acyl-phosphate glycerol 3-phosphate acyltransferase [Rhodobacteraceae bacterium]|nr:acyl-phosphate glycerol 3-phosphate acyltransferase [Paracoccaceae bacterium]MDC3160121.1 glycerol-3-phosphate 1-O-acyltransferase PlsY [Pseudomonadota bacterium]|tara:strand:+ start:2403 stop:3005 length:603 start_codon:yes stop_codon:yes gene_type:complete
MHHFFSVSIIGLAYLVGSFSSSITIAKLLKLDDPREKGSGNAGATNVLRYAGRWPAVATLIGDFLKGFLIVSFGKYFMLDELYLGLICFAAVFGHIYPIFYNFKGGKGVAVFIGVTAGLTPLTALLFCLAWLIIAKITKYSSLSAILATIISIPIIHVDQESITLTIIFTVIVSIIITKHKENIMRLRKGTEERIKTMVD